MSIRRVPAKERRKYPSFCLKNVSIGFKVLVNFRSLNYCISKVLFWQKEKRRMQGERQRGRQKEIKREGREKEGWMVNPLINGWMDEQRGRYILRVKFKVEGKMVTSLYSRPKLPSNN